MTAGMLISRRRIVLGSRLRAVWSVRASSWEKASRPAGQGHDQAPDAVLGDPLQGKAVKPGVLGAADTVLVAGPQPVAHLEIGELAHPRAGGEGGQSVAAHVLEAQLGSLVGPLSAHDDPHPLGPGGQVQQVSDLSDVRPLPGLSVSVVGRGPGGLGDGVVDLRRVVRQREPHAVGHPPTGQELNGLLRASGPVDAHQHLSTGSGAEPGLVQCPADDLDVVGGSV